MLPPDYRAKTPVRVGFIRAYVGPMAVKVTIGFLTLMGLYGLAVLLWPELGDALPYGEPIAWLLLWIAVLVIPVLAFKPLHDRLYKLELENYHFGLALEAGEPLVTAGLAIGQHREGPGNILVSRVNIYGALDAAPVAAHEIEVVVSRPLYIYGGMQALLADKEQPTLGEWSRQVKVERLTEQTYRLGFDEPVSFNGRSIYLRLILTADSDWSSVRRVTVVF